MKNTAIEEFCDWGIIFSIGASIFVLPASIAYLDSFAALAVFFYLSKKAIRIISGWPLRTPSLGLLGKIHFIWDGFAPPDNFLNVPLGILAVAVFISVLFSQYPALSFLAFIGKFLKCVFLYFSFIEAFSDEKRILIFLKLLLGSAFITALNGATQHYFGMDFLKGHFFTTDRINSTFFSANGLGAYLLPAIGLAAHLLNTAIVRKRSWAMRGMLAFFLILLLSCLCWTYSRSAWIGFLFILLVMVCMDPRKILYVGALFLVFIFIFLPSLNQVRHLYLINDNNGGVRQVERFYGEFLLEQGGSGRLAFWEQAVSIFRSSPVCGTGLNTYARIIKRDPDKEKWWYAHNSYLQMAAETGVLGLSSFLWMLFVLLRNGIDNCGRIKNSWPLTILQGCICGLFGFLVQSFFDNTLYTVQLSMLMWFIFGLMVAVMRLVPSVENI